MEDEDILTAEDRARLEEEAIRSAMRHRIRDAAGDTASILGTAADATQLLLYGMAMLVKGLSQANSLAEVREAAAPFAALSSDFLAKVESGEVKLPFMAKGIENVVADIEGRSTAVADVFAAFAADGEADGKADAEQAEG